MHFSGNTEILGFKKSTNFFTGFSIHFFVKIGTLGILKNRFSQNESEFFFFFKTKTNDFDHRLHC